MKKIICISFVVLFLMVSVPKADAQPFPGLLGGGGGLLSPSTAVAVFFNAFQGQALALGGVSDFVEGFCAVSTLSNPTFFIASGFIPSSILFLTAPVSDVYLFLCVHWAGFSDDIVLVALDNSFALLSMGNRESQNIEDYPPELKARVIDEINKTLGIE